MADNPPATGRQLELYRIIDRHLNHGVPIKLAALAAGLTVRQFYRHVCSYQTNGLEGLARKPRKDKGTRKAVSNEFQKLIEGMCLQKPKPTLRWVHRKLKEHCQKEGLKVPCYSVVWRIYDKIPGEQKVYAHEGEKAYKHEYGIIHRWTGDYPNHI
jgi:putative transposase